MRVRAVTSMVIDDVVVIAGTPGCVVGRGGGAFLRVRFERVVKDGETTSRVVVSVSPASIEWDGAAELEGEVERRHEQLLEAIRWIEVSAKR